VQNLILRGEQAKHNQKRGGKRGRNQSVGNAKRREANKKKLNFPNNETSGTVNLDQKKKLKDRDAVRQNIKLERFQEGSMRIIA